MKTKRRARRHLQPGSSCFCRPCYLLVMSIAAIWHYEQWNKLLDAGGDLRGFLEANRSLLKLRPQV